MNNKDYNKSNYVAIGVLSTLFVLVLFTLLMIFLGQYRFGRTYTVEGLSMKNVTINGKEYTRGYTGEMKWGRPNGKGTLAFVGEKDTDDWFILYATFKKGKPTDDAVIDNYQSTDPFGRSVVLYGDWNCDKWVPVENADIKMTYGDDRTTYVSYDSNGRLNGEISLPYPGSAVDVAHYTINHGIVMNEAKITVIDAIAECPRDYTIGVNPETGEIAPRCAIDQVVYSLLANEPDVEFDVDGIEKIKNVLTDDDIEGNNIISADYVNPFDGINVIDVTNKDISSLTASDISGVMIINKTYDSDLRSQRNTMNEFENAIVYNDTYTSFGNLDVINIGGEFMAFIGDKHIQNIRDYANAMGGETFLINMVLIGHYNNDPIFLCTYMGADNIAYAGAGVKADGFEDSFGEEQ